MSENELRQMAPDPEPLKVPEPVTEDTGWELTMPALIEQMQRKWDEFAAVRRLVYLRQEACAHEMEVDGEDADEIPWERCPHCLLRRPKITRP